MRALLVALALLAAPLAGCVGGDPASSPGDDARDGPGGATPVTWAFTDIRGVEQSSAASLGNASLFFFMATWCSTCMSRSPMLSDVHADYASDGVRFFSVSIDPRDSGLDAWQARYDHPWPHGIDEDGRLRSTFSVFSTSTMVLLDADGVVVEKWNSPGAPEDELRAALDAVTSP